MILTYKKIIGFAGKKKEFIKKSFFNHSNVSTKIAEARMNEIFDIIDFCKTIDISIKNIHNLNFLAFHSFLKHEHDLIFFMENSATSFVALFNIEIKNNIQLLKKQMKNHLNFFNKRLIKSNVMFFGVLYVPEKNIIKVYTLENNEMVEWHGNFNDILNLLIRNGFQFNLDPERMLAKLDTNFKEKLYLACNGDIELTSNETNLIKSIKDITKKNKVTIIDFNVTIQSTIIPFIMYLDTYKEKSDLLVLNYNIHNEIKDFEITNKIYFQKEAIALNKEKNNKYLIVVDGQRLTTMQILELCLVYKKIIMFGCTNEFNNKNKVLNLNRLSSDLINLGLDCHYLEYNSSANLSSNKNFINVIRYLFLPDKPKIDTTDFMLLKSISIYDNYKKFFNHFYSIDNTSYTKKMIVYLDFNNPQFEDKYLFFKTISKNGDKNIFIQNVCFDNYFFNVDSLFLIINLELGKIRKNSYILNNIIRACERAQKELNILIVKNNDYLDIKQRHEKIFDEINKSNKK